MNFEFSYETAVGFELRRLLPPPGQRLRWVEPGPLDGYGVWAPDAFTVRSTKSFEAHVRESVQLRRLAAWWPCAEAGRPRGKALSRPVLAPPWTAPVAEQVRPQLSEVLALIEGKPPLRLVEEFDLDLDGDRRSERLERRPLRWRQLPSPGKFQPVTRTKQPRLAPPSSRDNLARMDCRPGCGACCIAPSISSPIPGMPAGKAAGVRCIQLTADNRCLLFGHPERPAVCVQLRPGPEMCGPSPAHALRWLGRLESATRPG